MKSKKKNTKSLSAQKHRRRSLLNFSRICRYGFDSFVRNAWLSIAATAVMTITLLIIFTAFVAQNILTDTLGELRDKVSMSIYLKTDTSEAVGKELVTKVEQLPSVKSAVFVNADEAKTITASQNGSNPNVIAAINEATNKMPATLRVTLADINNTSELQSFVSKDSLLKKYLSIDYKPSFAGERRSTIQSIGRAVNFAQRVGIVAALIFIIISSLIIFNTIRMAIFNRKEEIQMMKLIGANQSFVRGPFLIEAMIYGFIAALFASGIGLFTLYKISPTLTSYQITAGPTFDLLMHCLPLLLVSMMLVGAMIGIVSSLLATRRYLKA